MNEDYRLRRLDEFNWTVDRRVATRKKNSRGKSWKTIGYFPSLDQAAQRLFDRILLTGKYEPSSIQELIEEIRAARDYVATLILRQPRAGRTNASLGSVGEAENESK